MVIYKVVAYGRWSLPKVVARRELTVFLLISPNDAVDLCVAHGMEFFFFRKIRASPSGIIAH